MILPTLIALSLAPGSYLCCAKAGVAPSARASRDRARCRGMAIVLSPRAGLPDAAISRCYHRRTVSGMNTAMAEENDVSRHYSSGQLMERLRAVLMAEGIDPEHPTVDRLAPFDHFHGRGLEATTQAADLVSARPTDHVLDVGS